MIQFHKAQKKLGYLSPYQYLKERLDMNNKEHVKLLNKIEAMKIRVEEHICPYEVLQKNGPNLVH